MTDALKSMGWDARWADAFSRVAAPDEVPARILVEYQDRLKLGTAEGEVEATLNGRLRDVHDRLERPAVGDWVAVRQAEGEAAVVSSLVERRTVFVRKAAGEKYIPQIIAANVERVFICTSLNKEFNARRLERYMTAVHAAQADPVLVLNKSDLDSADAFVKALPDFMRGLPIVVTSAKTGEGIDRLNELLEPGMSVAFVGSSGVGKSSLVNRVLGHDAFAVAALSDFGDRGRHTTRNRTLMPLPSGAILIDTPGMRELHLWVAEGALSEAFADVETAAEDCRFRDCAHGGEPGCAVAKAIADGTLDVARVASYRKLTIEVATPPSRNSRR